MEPVLLLIPDTNFFVQCKVPEELDWTEYSGYEQIELLITRPVQAELDSQKGKGSSRVANRARKASAVIRELLVSHSDTLCLREEKPRVSLRIRHDLLPDTALASRLFYSERDDQLVGVASTLMKEQPTIPVAILTHDTGPMASAKMVGVPFRVIADAWLLPRETNDEEKRTNALLAELERFRKAEPAFEISFFSEDAEIHGLEREVVCFEELSSSDVEQLIEELQAVFPEESDFGGSGKSESQTKADVSAAGLMAFRQREIFKPASEEDITKYQEELYPEWINTCTQVLKRLHAYLNFTTNWPRVKVSAQNVGSRPAEHALVTLSAKGPLTLFASDSYDSTLKDVEKARKLPLAPVAPKGKWKKLSPFSIAEYSRFGPAEALSMPYHAPIFPKLGRPDLNGFYWKPERPEGPVPQIMPECQQWRHQTGSEEFELHIRCHMEPGEYKGALEFRIDSSNMTESIQKRLSLKLRVVTQDSMPVARELIRRLASSKSAD